MDHGRRKGRRYKRTKRKIEISIVRCDIGWVMKHIKPCPLIAVGRDRIAKDDPHSLRVCAIEQVLLNQWSCFCYLPADGTNAIDTQVRVL